jgi:N utilization substance protein A
MEVVVPDEQLSLAIGKRGQNVRLASRLTGWKIDVKSESKYDKSMRDGYQSLLQITGVGEATADALYKQGFQSAQEVSEASLEELLQVPGLSQKKAEKLQESASAFLNLEKQKDALDKQREEETRLQEQDAEAETASEQPAEEELPPSAAVEGQE